MNDFYNDMGGDVIAEPTPTNAQTTESANYAMFDTQTSPELVRELLQNDDILLKVEHLLKGEIYNDEQGKWIKVYKPLMNDEGINNLLLDLSLRIHKNLILSNFDEQDVMRIALETRKQMVTEIYMNGDNYGLKVGDTSSKSRIVKLLDHAVYSSLRRAFMHGEKDFLGRSVTHSENVVNNAQSKRSKANFLQIFKKGGLV